VASSNLGLSSDELDIFLAMVGPRYNPGRKDLKIVCDRFPNRIENKKYSIIILEVVFKKLFV
jgi:Mitochondrial ribosomal subunit protein